MPMGAALVKLNDKVRPHPAHTQPIHLSGRIIT
jgi:hypothetical protein